MSNIYIQIDDDTYLSIHQDEESGIQECVPMRYKDNALLGHPAVSYTHLTLPTICSV